ncbi:hypothetical protein BgiBS90_008117 [Biomphalaria glabrata]|nr:hypothetical protein BgiBS90_008117 [Biomphalaria glabrata]
MIPDLLEPDLQIPALLTLHKCPNDNASHRPVTGLTESSRSRALPLRIVGLHSAPGPTTPAHQQTASTPATLVSSVQHRTQS